MTPIAYFPDPKLTGLGAMERFAREAGREAQPNDDGTFSFRDGVKRYRVEMVKGGWKIFEVREDGK